MNIQVLLLSILIFAMPYNLIGENMGNLIIMECGLLFILLKHIKIKSIDSPAPDSTKNPLKYYYVMLIFLALIGFLSLFTIKSYDIFGSLHGLTIYINGIIFFKIFFDFSEDDKLKFYGYSASILSILCIFFIFYQGLILKVRIDGTVGYANTYSLLLIAGLYFNVLAKKSNFSVTVNTLIMLAILYTGSRNSLFYLILFIIFHVIYERKNSKDLSILFSFITSMVCFGILQSGGILILVFIPPILYISHILIKNLKFFNNNIKTVLLIIFTAIGLVLFIAAKDVLEGSIISRLINISLHEGVLQERFVYFEDAVKSISSNIFGNGINSFAYKQYIHQSAFYDVRFIHNSVLQIAYDIGIIAAVLFIVIFIFGIITILKSSNKYNSYFSMLYLTIFMHSLLDFDFSFASIFILFIIPITFTNTKLIQKSIINTHLPNKKTFRISYLVVYITILIFGSYTLFCDAIIFAGNTFYSYKNYNNALTLYNISYKLQFKANPYTCLSIAEVYNQKHKCNSKKSIMFLKRAEKLNPYDPIITGNMAFTYENLGDLSKADNYYLKFMKKEIFYYEPYNLYYNFLKKHYSKSSTNYKHGKAVMKKTYMEAKKTLNKRAAFMKNQLSNNFLDK